MVKLIHGEWWIDYCQWLYNCRSDELIMVICGWCLTKFADNTWGLPFIVDGYPLQLSLTTDHHNPPWFTPGATPWQPRVRCRVILTRATPWWFWVTSRPWEIHQPPRARAWPRDGPGHGPGHGMAWFMMHNREAWSEISNSSCLVMNYFSSLFTKVNLIVHLINLLIESGT